MLRGICTGRKLSFHRRFREKACICNQGTEIPAHEFYGVIDKGFLAWQFFHRCIEVAFSKRLDTGHGLLLHIDMAKHHSVDAFSHAPEATLELRRIYSDIDITLVVLGGHAVHIIQKRLNRGCHTLHSRQ